MTSKYSGGFGCCWCEWVNPGFMPVAARNKYLTILMISL